MSGSVRRAKFWAGARPAADVDVGAQAGALRAERVSVPVRCTSWRRPRPHVLRGALASRGAGAVRRRPQAGRSLHELT